jgi:hypothetical protein
MMTTSRTRAVVLLGTTFFLGLAVGGVGMAVADKSKEDRAPERICEVRSRQVCFWAEELALSPDQQEQVLQVYRRSETVIDSIHATVRPSMDSVYQTIRPRVDSLRSALREQVRPLLTPTQRETYDSTVQAMDERRRQGRDHGGNGGTPRARP